MESNGQHAVNVPSESGGQQHPWQNTQASADERATALVTAMTRDEKLLILSTPMTVAMREHKPSGVPISFGHIPGIPRLGLPPVAETDASLGVSNFGDIRPGDFATALPSSLALGASFDPDLARRGGEMIGGEARAKGFGIMLAGGVNLIRDPRGGRCFEYVSEDPLLTGVLGGHAIAGIQSNRIVSTVKHFAVNDLETGRNVYDVEMPEAVMRETDLLAFEIAHDIGRPGSVMGAYNRVNGEYTSGNRFLMTDVLRRDWGFEGFVMTDWGSLHAVAALEAGTDQQSGYQLDAAHFYGPMLNEALDKGEVPMAAVDRAATRILRTLFLHGVYDDPPQPGAAIGYAANARVAQAQAEAGIVLLQNRENILPLSSAIKRIAVIGGHADIGVLFGGGSAQVTPVGGVKLAVEQEGEGIVAFTKRTYGGIAPLDALRAAFPVAQIEFDSGVDHVAAAALAKAADVAVVFAETWAFESKDVDGLALDAGQDGLIAAVAAANPTTVVVLETGNPVAMPWRDAVAAILQAWFPGQCGGAAIARILAGEVNPSGRLPITFPKSAGQLPMPKLPAADVPAPPPESKSNFGVLADKMPFTFAYPEGRDVGYRWYERRGAEPLFPFGFGLSYTSFTYASFAVQGGEGIAASLSVINTGDRPGIDTPQLYVTPPGGTRRLCGWGRAGLAPGEQREISIVADPRVFAEYDTVGRCWVARAGTYKVELATSAISPVAAIEVVLTGITLPVDTRRENNSRL